MPKHIVRLLLLLAGFGVLAVSAKAYFTDASFGVYGHYRGDSVAEIAAEAPVYKGAASCRGCHGPRHAEWSAAAHKVVTCETCHGAAGEHPGRGAPVASADGRTHARLAAARYVEVTGKLAIPTDTVKLCTLCHEKTAGRPAFQRQVEVGPHAGGQACIACHNPHAPRLALVAAAKAAPAGSAAAGKEKAAVCASCHGANGVSSNPSWPSLAGQRPGYLSAALKAYQSGARRDPMMTGLAQGQSAADIADLAVYYAGLACQTAGATGPAADAAAGKEKAGACAACHGAAGISPNPIWPGLAGQHQTYLVAALKAYKSGARRDPMMANLAKNLSETDMRQLAAYYAGAACK